MATVADATRAEQSRALSPDAEGFVERDGVRLFYEVYGRGEPTVLFLPTWSIMHSRGWKMQIPYFARHCRVVTFDGRGNGKSDRPSEPEAYAETEFAADALAVMDATETERAVIVSLSRGAERSLLIGAGHPDRIAGMVFIAPALPLPPATPRAGAEQAFVTRLESYEGWNKWNQHYWLDRLRGLRRVLLLAGLHRAALDQAARGRSRLGAGDRRRDARRHPACAASSGRSRRACADRPHSLAGPRHPRPRRCRQTPRLRRGVRRASRGDLRLPGGLRPLPTGA